MSLLQRVVKIEDKMTDRNMWGDIPHPPRSSNKYPDDKFTKNESSDPFADIVLWAQQPDQDKLALVKEVCEDKVSAAEFVDNFLA